MAIIPDLQRAFDDAVRGAERRGERIGYTGDGNGNVTVAHKPGWYYVRIGAEGSLTVTQAKNHPKLGVPPDPDLPIRVRRENGVLTIYGDEPLSMGSVPTELGDLADVITGGEANHQVLEYRSADAMWVNRYLALYTGPAQTAVIAANAINVTGSSHWRVQAETGTSGTVDTIASDQAGHRVVLRPVPGHTILLRNGVGNLSLHNGDCSLSSDDHALELLYISGPPARWIELGRTAGTGGGLIYSAGSGIEISGSVIAVNLAAQSGLTFEGMELTVASGLAGNGLGLNASKQLYVNLGTPSGLEIVSDALRIRNDLAGAGLNMNASKIIDINLAPSSGLSTAGDQLKVDYGRGLRVTAGQLEVNEDFAFVWENVHTFAANINISGDRSIVSTAGSDLTIDLGTSGSPGNLYLADDQVFRSATYSPGIPIDGFSLFKNPLGQHQLTIEAIQADEIHTRAFVADMVRIDVGEEYWGKSMGILARAFTTPAIGATVAIRFEDSAGFAGALFSNGDWLLFRIVQPASGTVAASVWGQVSGYADGGDGTQYWTFTMRQGPVGLDVSSGTVGVDFGASGQGFVHLSALADAQGPWIRLGQWTGANPYTPPEGSAEYGATMTQIGRLDNVNDPELNPAGWGLYSDNAYLHGMVRTPNAILSDEGVVLFNVSQTNYNELDAYKFARDNQVVYGGLYGYWNDANPDAQRVILRTQPGPYQNEVWLQAAASGAAGVGRVLIEATQSSLSPAVTSISVERSPGISSIAIQASSIGLTLNDPFDPNRFIGVAGAIRPTSDNAYDLGHEDYRWRTLYVNQLIADVVSGPALTGQQWTYPGNMTINADPAGGADATVSITNLSTGTAHLSVEGNITLGGTVDGVDLADMHSDFLTLQGSFQTHIDDTNIHHERATAGNGITVSGTQQIAIRLQPTTSGLTLAGGDLSVNVGAGLIVPSQLQVDPDYAFVWTGQHTHQQNLYFAGGADLNYAVVTEAGANVQLFPANHLYLGPGSLQVIVSPNRSIKSQNYASQVSGWQIGYDGSADFRHLFVDELQAKSFIADLEQALAGGQIISKSVAVLAADFTLPAGGTTATMVVSDLPSAPNMPVFEVSDLIRLRTFDRSGGELHIADAWGLVGSYVDNADGTQNWNFTRSAGGLAGSASGVIAAKSIVLDYGKSGNGFYEVNAIDGLYGVNSPYAQVVSWHGHPEMVPLDSPLQGEHVRVRMGNLAGVGFAGEYGLYARGSAADQYLAATGDGLRLQNANVEIMSGTLYAGDGPVGTTGNQYIYWDGSNLTIQGTVLLPGGDPLPGEDFPFLEQTEAVVPAGYNGLMMTADKFGFVFGGAYQTYLDDAGNFIFGAAGGNSLEWDRATGRLSGSDSTGVQWYADVNDRGILFAGGGQVGMTRDGLIIEITELLPGETERDDDPSKISWFPDISTERPVGEVPWAEVSAFMRNNVAIVTGISDPAGGYDTRHVALRARHSFYDSPYTAARAEVTALAYGTLGVTGDPYLLNRFSPTILLTGVADRMGQLILRSDRDSGLDTNVIEMQSSPSAILPPIHPHPALYRKKISHRSHLHEFWVPDEVGVTAGMTFAMGDEWIWFVGRNTSGTKSFAISSAVESVVFEGTLITGELHATVHIVPGTGALAMAAGSAEPRVATVDLGQSSNPFRTLYVDNIVTSGGIPLSGSTWQYDAGDMYIKSNHADDHYLHVINEGAGVMHLELGGDLRMVNGNINLLTAGATVDGVDISAFKAAYDSHVAAHPGGGVPTSRQIISGGGLSGGGDLSADRTLAVGAGDGITVLADSVAVDATVVRTGIQVIAGSGLTGGGAFSGGNVTLSVNPGDGLQIVSDAVAVDSSVVRDTRTITAGAGLGGGGALSSNLALAVNAGDGLQIAGDDVAVDSSVVRTTRQITAGAGLTGTSTLATNVTLAVGQGDGILVNADDIAVRLHANAGLELASATLRMGTPMTLDVNTSDQVLTNTHSHNIDSTADADAQTGKILHATSAGGLILRTLDVMGDLEVLNNGDFWVGSGANPALRVLNTGDPSTSYVGINTIGDSQFALDVNGPARAQYFIGPHAIQLEDAVMICHYDGSESSDAGELNGHYGQVGTATGSAIFVRGKFGKALSIGPASTGLVTNPSFETGVSNWTAETGTLTQVAPEEAAHGKYVGMYTSPAATGVVYAQASAVSEGQSLSFSVWLRGENTTTACRVALQNSGRSVTYGTASITVTPEWSMYTVTATVPAGHTTVIGVVIVDTFSSVVYIDAAQIVAGYTYAIPFVPGTRSTTSYVDYAISGIRNDRGTLMVWVRPWSIGGSGGYVVQAGTTTANRHTFFLRTDNKIQALCGSGSLVSTATISTGVWTHLALTWERGTARLYINGEQADSAFAYTTTSTPATLRIGNNVATLHGEVDDVVLLARASPPEEVRAVYESNAPVFAESSTFSFRATPKGLIWADEEGLWMRDANGLEVLGAYGGEAASKSWGNTTLNPGDILFGRHGASMGGWLKFQRTGGLGSGILNVGYGDKEVWAVTSSGAKLTGYLTIDTGGGIYQGTATPPAPANWGTGLRIYNDSGKGRLVGYNAGVEQVVIDTDGKLKAGAASVVLDANGMVILAGTTPPNKIQWQFGAINMGDLYVDPGAGTDGFYWVARGRAGGADGTIEIQTRTSGDVLQAKTRFVGTQIYMEHGLEMRGVGLSGSNTTWLNFARSGVILPVEPTTAFVKFDQNSTTLTRATLELGQADLSEEFINFRATSGATNPVSTAALGAYAGKVRVAINDTFFWMPYYS